jgi:hypothetical protein
VPVTRWSSAASARKPAIAAPIGTSNSGSAAGTRVPGGPSGKLEVSVIAKSLASTSTATA